MISMKIGSGDVSSLLAGYKTKAFGDLLRKFVSDEKVHYNSLASPINVLRTGAILEDRYLKTLDYSWYPQYVVTSQEMDVLKASLDFAKIEDGLLVDFRELKSIEFNDFLKIQALSEDLRIPYVLKNYKKYYNQIQQQLYCSKLKSCTLVFLAVYSYDDDENYNRSINENECIEIIITEDIAVQNMIKERAKIFQHLKDLVR